MKIIFMILGIISPVLFSFYTNSELNEYSHNISNKEAIIPVEMRIEPGRSIHYVDEPIEVHLTNYSGRKVYIVNPQSSSWKLQKLDFGGWRNIDTSLRRISTSAVVSYTPIEPGQSKVRLFPNKRMKELGKEIPGRYRYVVTISQYRNRDEIVKIYSPEFSIRERGL